MKLLCNDCILNNLKLNWIECGATWKRKYASFRSSDMNHSHGHICARICVICVPSGHPEWPFHQGVIQEFEIWNRLQATVFFGGEEVAAVEAWNLVSAPWWWAFTHSLGSRGPNVIGHIKCLDKVCLKVFIKVFIKVFMPSLWAGGTISMAPFSSRFITSARRTWASSQRTVVASTPRKRGGFRANWRV